MNAEMLKGILKKPIEELELTMRSYNCLKSEQIKTIEDLVRHTEVELFRAPGLGKKSMEEIKEVLNHHGLKLSMKPGELPLITVDVHDNLRHTLQVAATYMRMACDAGDPVKAYEYSRLVVQIKHILEIE